MQPTSKTTTTNRVLTTLALAALWLAGGGWAADPAAVPGKPAPATNPPAAAPANEAVVLDFSTLWRQFHVEGPSYLRLSNGTLKATQIDFSDGSRPNSGVAYPSQDWEAPGASVTNVFGYPGPRADGLWNAPPPAEWNTPGFDDSAWPRLLWPKPDANRLWFDQGPCLYDTVLILARGTFEVKDPAQVQECRTHRR